MASHRVIGQSRGAALMAALSITAVAIRPAAAQETGEMLDLSVCSPSAGGFTLTSTNPYFPMEVGSRWILEGGDERVVITVLDETEVVAGIETRVVEEREFEDDELVEVSRNYFAQAKDGTVCYFGEGVDIFEDGEIVSHEEEWRADMEGSRAGIIMPADPRPGMKFQMEAAPGVAEDAGEILEVGSPVEVPAGTFANTVRLREFNPLEDDDEGDKVYAAGVGMIVDEELELVSR